MTADQRFVLHPEAALDITEVWEFIARDNPLAARRVREDIFDTVRKLVSFPHQGHRRPDLTHIRCFTHVVPPSHDMSRPARHRRNP